MPASVPTAEAPVLSVRNLIKHYESRRRFLGGSAPSVLAVDDISFDIQAQETLGLVGESGCGKSTAARAIMRLIEPSSGEVFLNGHSLTAASGVELRRLRRGMQMVFQDPYSSLNTRMRVRDIIAEPLRNYLSLSESALEENLIELIACVGLEASHLNRYPHEFSGGQRQRIGIARALALRPQLIICDEPVSALDVSVRAQVVNLLRDLQARFALSYLFVAHDIAVVEHISHRVAVMYLGRIVEIGPTKDVLGRPLHPYTQALLSAVPRAHPRAPRQRMALTGDIPSPLSPPSGCRFHPRCPIAVERCRRETPVLRVLDDGHFAACHLSAPPNTTAARSALERQAGHNP
jgi:oligopeptide/dipeptide ABC transporter ATP-binding protein